MLERTGASCCLMQAPPRVTVLSGAGAMREARGPLVIPKSGRPPLLADA